MFLYERDLRHERVNQLHLLEQVRGVIRALQESMMILSTKIVTNISLKILTILAKTLILVAWLGPGRVSDGFEV